MVGSRTGDRIRREIDPATTVGAVLLLIRAAVDRLYLDFRGPNGTALGAVTLAECRRFIEEGHFPAGSMGPKVEAIHSFLEQGGRRGLITSPDRLNEALDGAAGTHFVGKI